MQIVEQLKDVHEELELLIRELTSRALMEHKDEIQEQIATLIDRMAEIGVELEGLDG